MGANQSSIISNSNNSSSPNFNSLSAQLSSRHGFQILRIHPNSPVSEARVSPYFDYIIAVNGVEVSPDMPNLISEMAKNHVNKPLKMTIYNSRQDEQREVTIVPRTGWGGEGLLGCAIRFSPLDGVRDRVWHILKVQNNSPAHRAGLIEEKDFIIASPDFIIRSQDDFYELITQNIKREIKLIVFNEFNAAADFKGEELREITIVPDFEWGGEGCLGCDVGSGMLHWVPKKIFSVTEGKKISPDDTHLDQNQHPHTQLNHSNIQSTAPISITVPLGQSLLFNTQSTQNNTSSAVPAPVPVLVQIPQSRPVIDNLSSNPNPNISANPQIHPIHPPTIPHMIPAIINPSSHVTTATEFNDDDIPKPNFSVPSDIIS